MYSEYKKKISQQEAEANAKLMFTDSGERDPVRKIPFKGNFVIETRLNDPKYGGQGLPWKVIFWTMVGELDKSGVMSFKTKTEAEQAIRSIRTYGPDWAAAEYRVVKK